MNDYVLPKYGVQLILIGLYFLLVVKFLLFFIGLLEATLLQTSSTFCKSCFIKMSNLSWKIVEF